MNTRLTLSMNKRIIEKSKKYAASQNMSLSHLIESYLRSVTTSDVKTTHQTSNRIQALRGSIKVPPEFDYDYKKMIRNEIIRKHG
ncbi:MAG: DUF6364 family protein [Saprospiraceae bacterium]